MKKRAIVLAGGFGTRLRSVVQDVPKPLAPVDGRPFLHYVLDVLVENGFGECVLSTYYMAEMVRQECGSSYKGLAISYAQEKMPMGTGGAIQFASSFLTKGPDPFFVLNGDTFLEVDYDAMLALGREKEADAVIAAKHLENCSRYGTLKMENGRITGFNAAGYEAEGFINGGIYLLGSGFLGNFGGEKPFSFEKDFLEPECGNKRLMAYETDGYFIDIGVPEDYRRAQKELKHYVGG